MTADYEFNNIYIVQYRPKAQRPKVEPPPAVNSHIKSVNTSAIMVNIAVTGSIACGKSALAGMLEDRGFEVCEADELAHEAMRKGNDVFEQVLGRFGDSILDDKGNIDRKVLAERVFSNPTELAELNTMTHPRVDAMLKDWLTKLDRETKGSAVIIPLLYESGIQAGWDAVICVVCSEHEQLRRLMERGLSEEESMLRIHSQLPQQEKAIRADYVVINNSSLDVMEKQLDCILENILKDKEIHR